MDSNILKKINNYSFDCIIDMAWDSFSEVIGEKKLSTPITIVQFEEIFVEINQKQNFKFSNFKTSILRSLQQDSYYWPLVENYERGDYFEK